MWLMCLTLFRQVQAKGISPWICSPFDLFRCPSPNHVDNQFYDGEKLVGRTQRGTWELSIIQTHNYYLTSLANLVSLGLAMTGVTTHLVKVTVGRPRPGYS